MCVDYAWDLAEANSTTVRDLYCLWAACPCLSWSAVCHTSFLGLPSRRRCALVAMSESPEVCQFSSTEAISQHSYTISASNLVQRFVKGLGTVASTNYVKISALVKNTWTFSSYFVIFLCNFEVITGFILLLTVTCNIRQWTTNFCIPDWLPKETVQVSDCNFDPAPPEMLLFTAKKCRFSSIYPT